MRDPLGVSEIDALRYGWEDLRTTVKHQQRFFFVLQPQDDPGDDSGRTIARGGRLLEELARLIREHDLVADVEARCPLYRVRPHSADGAPATARALGAPPADYASQSRMSPAGIPMFYAADELETALAETLDPDESPPDAVTIARFETTEACRIVDLSRLAEVPSIFDDSEEARTLRPPLLFLHGFAPGCQRRHQEDNQIHIEHVPTQVVSEYLRHVFRDAEGRMVRGLACESSRRPGARNVVLFLDNDRCVEPRRASAVPKKGSPSRVQRSLDLLRSTARRTSRDSPSSAVGSQLRVVADPRRRTSGRRVRGRG